jgi:hypothetical protein
VSTLVYGDFEWDEEKAVANEAQHGVRFGEAAQAFTDPYAVDLADAVEPNRLVTLAMSPHERIPVRRDDRAGFSYPHHQRASCQHP